MIQIPVRMAKLALPKLSISFDNLSGDLVLENSGILRFNFSHFKAKGARLIRTLLARRMIYISYVRLLLENVKN